MVPLRKPSLIAFSTTSSWSMPTILIRLSPILRNAFAAVTAGTQDVVTNPSTTAAWAAI
jgi:hypothetical protein